MKWRDQSQDIEILNTFLQKLREFQYLKSHRWEKVDEQVQMAIIPGSPSEDWIVPPDENKTLHILQNDQDYVRLRTYLIGIVPKIKECAKFLRIDTHHDFDWVIFTTPLIGNAALEDAISAAERLLNQCKTSNYLWKNFLALVS